MLGVVPRRLRVRLELLSAAGGALVVLGALAGMVLLSGIRLAGSWWALIAVVAGALAVGVVLGRRALTPEDRAVVEDSRRRVLPPIDAQPVVLTDVPIDLPAGRAGDRPPGATTAAPPFGPDPLVVSVRPGPVNRRRLAGAPPESSVLVADQDALRFPAWLLERRPPGLAAVDVVVVRWDTIRRWRVRDQSDGPDVWALECTRSVGSSGRWLVRRGEVVDEVAVLDHARAVGRVTVELEASVRRGPRG